MTIKSDAWKVLTPCGEDVRLTDTACLDCGHKFTAGEEFIVITDATCLNPDTDSFEDRWEGWSLGSYCRSCWGKLQEVIKRDRSARP